MANKVMMQNVRLSFPSIFKRSSFNGQEGKFEATLLLDKEDTKTYDKLQALIADALKEAKFKVPKDKWFLKDGNDSEYDGYEGNWSIKAANNQRPLIIDKDKTPLAEDDGKPYAGCYVNAQIGVWIQNNNYGKRVNANLYGIQFVKDGETFGVDNTSDLDDFDDVDDDF